MQEYMNKGIKELIAEFPYVGDILNEYNIGCVPCNVGTCLLKDIVKIHNLSPQDEQELMARISGIIHSNEDIKTSGAIQKKIPAKTEKPALEEIKYSPPIKKLVEEHKLIKKMLKLIPELIENLNLEKWDSADAIKECTDFIRNYADKYHHAKEEDILFKYFDTNLDILKVMHTDHENARAYVRAILDGLENWNKDRQKIAEHLNAYKELLSEHIKKEDEILYPWMDRNLSTHQVGELFSRFKQVDEACEGSFEKYEEFVKRQEKKYEEVMKNEV